MARRVTLRRLFGPDGNGGGGPERQNRVIHVGWRGPQGESEGVGPDTTPRANSRGGPPRQDGFTTPKRGLKEDKS